MSRPDPHPQRLARPFYRMRAAAHAVWFAGWVLLFALPLLAAPVSAQEPAAPAAGLSEEVLSGFDDPLPAGSQELEGGFSEQFGEPLQVEPGAASQTASGAEGQSEAPPAEGRPWWELDGFVRFDGAYNYAHKAPPPGETDYRGLSKLRLALQLELPLRLGGSWESFVSGQAFYDFAYQLRGEERYTQEVLDTYQEEAEFREVYLRGTPLERFDVKLGRQIVVWGKSDNIRVVDVLNPLDLREPGLTDLEDLRLPVTMTRLDYYLGAWSLTGIAVHEIRFNKEPPRGSDFYPAGRMPLPPEEKPSHGGRNTEWAASLGGIFSGWDLALYWAQFFDDNAYIADGDGDPATDDPVRRHARLHMGGAGLNVAAGNWLLKSEGARFSGLRFFNRPDRTFERVDLLLGIEYSGLTDTTLALEAVDRHLLDYDPVLELPPDGQREDSNQYALSYRGSFLREQLDLAAVFSAFGARGEQGTLQRYQFTYELATALDFTGGMVIFTAGEGKNFLLTSAQDNDRVFFETKWSF